MKRTIFTLLLLASAATGQLFTNQVSIVYSQAQKDDIQAANDLDNNARTNGFSPYTVATNALTLLQYFASQAPLGLDLIATQTIPQREAELMNALRNASPAKRLAAYKAAWAVLNQ